MGELDNLHIRKSCLKGVGCWLFVDNREPLREKWPVAPELKMAYFTAQHTLRLSKMVTAIVSSCKSFVCTMVFHAFGLVHMEIRGGMMIGMIGVIAGILISQARLDVRYGP